MIKSENTYDVSKAILSSKNVSKTVWDIINYKTKPRNQFKITIKEGIVLNGFFAYVSRERGPRQNQYVKDDELK